MTEDDIKRERVVTPNGKRRGVVRVLKAALQDAQIEASGNRVVGIFGVVIKEDGTARLLSALTSDELKIVLKAIPEALNTIATQIKMGGASEPTH